MILIYFQNCTIIRMYLFLRRFRLKSFCEILIFTNYLKKISLDISISLI